MTPSFESAQPTAADAGLRLIDLEQHPIDRLDDPEGKRMIEEAREELGKSGCLAVRDLLTPDAVERISFESSELSSKAHFNHGKATIYGGAADESVADTNPRNRLFERFNGFVAGDCIGPGTALRRLYHDETFQRFIAACVGTDQIHEFADPLAGLVINVLPPNAEHAWHFDTNEFIVTMLTRKSEKGGFFEYCPGIRDVDDENYEDVAAVLDGDRTRVKSLDLNPGDLQIFFGRNSLHRVSTVLGESERHTMIFGYSKEQNMVGSAQKTRNLFGRTAAAHEA